MGSQLEIPPPILTFRDQCCDYLQTRGLNVLRLLEESASAKGYKKAVLWVTVRDNFAFLSEKIQR